MAAKSRTIVRAWTAERVSQRYSCAGLRPSEDALFRGEGIERI